MFEIETEIKITPKLAKDFRAAWFNYKRVKPIKRTRKRQIDKAKHMQAWADHTSYEWSQWWHKIKHRRFTNQWGIETWR